jgi:hypothetical protein
MGGESHQLARSLLLAEGEQAWAREKPFGREQLVVEDHQRMAVEVAVP